ncbi:NAD-dependent epimerase/dehydratase family protein [Aliarcobacter butzleri]|uniref:NAD-dependent epimerase/dehydratase family protein n=1 Tax=Aliarcobacter butzleri TaxID=28197 RepID=UPI003B210A91
MTIIIGKNSNLSQSLCRSIGECYAVSSVNTLKEIETLEINPSKKINIIFNNFQKSSLLNNLSYPSEYIQRSIMTTADVLSYVKEKQISINKIIYTSSSSVYGNNIFCSEKDTLMPVNLHASIKIANEKLIETFCIQHDIDYTICRIFNMYGGNDDFSIISKVINSVKLKRELILFNNGNAIRDFIHIDNVVEIYKKILMITNVPILNIGTSNGVSIKSIIDIIIANGYAVNYQTYKRDELKTSTSNNDLLKQILVDIQLMDIYQYVLTKVGE